MLNHQTQLTPATNQTTLTSPDQLNQIRASLALHGYCLLRGFESNLDSFTNLTRLLCRQVTFDPARNTHNNAIQKVDAGTGAIGLHIENGNTPNVPEIIGFYCKQAPEQSSPTTFCDGIKLLNSLPPRLRSNFSTSMTVTRSLPEMVWKRYLKQEHPEYASADNVSPDLLQQLLNARPGQSGRLMNDGSLLYSLTVDIIRNSPLCNRAAFANALLGPSLHHEKPVYELHNNIELTTELLEALCAVAEEHTEEIDWQTGDIVLLDNWRVMHGRRAIQDGTNRQLYIGMGNL